MLDFDFMRKEFQEHLLRGTCGCAGSPSWAGAKADGNERAQERNSRESDISEGVKATSVAQGAQAAGYDTAGFMRSTGLDAQEWPRYTPPPPPQAVFSRTFLRPNKPPAKAAQPDRAAPEAQQIAQASKDAPPISYREHPNIEPAPESGSDQGLLESRGNDQQFDPFLAMDATDSRPTSNTAAEADLALGERSGRELYDQSLGNGVQIAAGVSESKDISRQPRHERVASLNAWTQESAPNIRSNGGLEDSTLAFNKSKDPAALRLERGSSVGQDKEAASSFDFRRPATQSLQHEHTGESAERCLCSYLSTEFPGLDLERRELWDFFSVHNQSHLRRQSFLHSCGPLLLQMHHIMDHRWSYQGCHTLRSSSYLSYVML